MEVSDGLFGWDRLTELNPSADLADCNVVNVVADFIRLIRVNQLKSPELDTIAHRPTHSVSLPAD